MALRPHGRQVIDYSDANSNFVLAVDVAYDLTAHGITVSMTAVAGALLQHDNAFIVFDDLVVTTTPVIALRQVPNAWFPGRTLDRNPVRFDFSFPAPGVDLTRLDITLALRTRPPTSYTISGELFFEAPKYRTLSIWLGIDGIAIIRDDAGFWYTDSRRAVVEAGNLIIGWDVNGRKPLTDELHMLISHMAPLGFFSHLFIGTKMTAQEYLDAVFAELEANGKWELQVSVDPLWFNVLHQLWGGITMVLPASADDWIEIYDLFGIALDPTVPTSRRVLAAFVAPVMTVLAVTDFTGTGVLTNPLEKAAKRLALAQTGAKVGADVGGDLLAHVDDLSEQFRRGADVLEKQGADARNVSALRDHANNLHDLARSFDAQRHALDDEELAFLTHAVESIQDWRIVSATTDLNHFLAVTDGWTSARRGYAFEYWIRFNKSMSEPEKFRTWGHLTMDSPKGRFRADRFFPKGADGKGRIWEFKHYHPGSTIDLGQMERYVAKMNEDPKQYKGVVYLFSTEDAARENARMVERRIADGNREVVPNVYVSPPGEPEVPDRAVHILYLRNDAKISRLARVTPDGFAWE